MKKLLAMFLCALMLLTSAAAVAEGANIVWAGWSGEEEATKDIFQKMMDTYEAETGNTVTWVGWTWADTAQQLLIRVQGGEQLDIAQTDISIFNTVAQAGVLADWTEILGEDYLKENFEEAALASGRIDGKQLGLPWSMASISMVYNPELLAAAGWDTVPVTIEEFEACMADIKALDETLIPYGLSTKDAICAGDFLAVGLRRQHLWRGRQRDHQQPGHHRLPQLVQEPAGQGLHRHGHRPRRQPSALCAGQDRLL